MMMSETEEPNRENEPVRSVFSEIDDASCSENVSEELLIDALAEFAAGAGHEINNPLAIISGHAQLLLAKCDDAETRRHLAIIVAQVKRAYEMIADVRLFSRPPEPIFSPFDPVEWLESLSVRFRQSFPDWSGSLEILPATGAFASPQTDAAILSSILDALLKNGVEANRSGVDGKILLSCRALDSEKGPLLEFTLDDNGPGIPDSVRPHLFSPYYSGRSSGRGLGFGLPRSAAFARKLGGTLRCEKSAAFPSGARFVLTVPVRENKEEA